MQCLPEGICKTMELAKEVFQAFNRKGITKMVKEDQVDILELLMRNSGLQN